MYEIFYITELTTNWYSISTNNSVWTTFLPFDITQQLRTKFLNEPANLVSL